MKTVSEQFHFSPKIPEDTPSPMTISHTKRVLLATILTVKVLHGVHRYSTDQDEEQNHHRNQN